MKKSMRASRRVRTEGTMRLALVGPLPPPAGGMANQTRQLAGLLRTGGVDVALVRTNEPYRPAWVESIRGVRAAFRLAPYVLRLASLAKACDVAHVMANSGWALHLFAAPAVRLMSRRNVPVIVNYRGGLAREFLRRSGSSVLRTLRRTDALPPAGLWRVWDRDADHSEYRRSRPLPAGSPGAARTPSHRDRTQSRAHLRH